MRVRGAVAQSPLAPRPVARHALQTGIPPQPTPLIHRVARSLTGDWKVTHSSSGPFPPVAFDFSCAFALVYAVFRHPHPPAPRYPPTIRLPSVACARQTGAVQSPSRHTGPDSPRHRCVRRSLLIRVRRTPRRVFTRAWHAEACALCAGVGGARGDFQTRLLLPASDQPKQWGMPRSPFKSGSGGRVFDSDRLIPRPLQKGRGPTSQRLHNTSLASVCPSPAHYESMAPASSANISPPSTPPSIHCTPTMHRCS